VNTDHTTPIESATTAGLEGLQSLAAKADGSMGSLMAQANLDPRSRYLDHARLRSLMLGGFAPLPGFA
jgi:hypothetical protein